jgi:hypothetical protein
MNYNDVIEIMREHVTLHDSATKERNENTFWRNRFLNSITKYDGLLEQKGYIWTKFLYLSPVEFARKSPEEWIKQFESEEYNEDRAPRNPR